MTNLLHQTKKNLYFKLAGYFQHLASRSFKKWRPRVIAVTGSAGKTTMLNLIETQLGSKAHYSHNANSAFGVSFDVLGLTGIKGSKLKWIYLILAAPIKALYFKRTENFYVVEIDGERPHEAEFNAKWLKPEVTLWVSLDKSHAIQFDSLVKTNQFKNVDDAIANEFAWLARMAQKMVIYNNDNVLIKQSVAGLSAKTLPVSLDNLKNYQVWPDKTEFEFNDTKFNFNYPMPKQVAVQLSMLIELDKYLGIKVNSDMSHFKLEPGRNSFFNGIKGTKLIDSSYNAHLISMKSILEMMQLMQVDHKWLVIGDMIDQGSVEQLQHQELGRYLAGIDADKYILVGKRTNKYTLPILEGKIDPSKVVSFISTTDTLDYIKNNIVGNETILFKGSQYLEWIIEKLLDNPDDKVKLVRQDEAAKKRRAKWGLN